MPKERAKLVRDQTGAERPRRGEPELRRRPYLEECRVETERFCRASGEFGPWKDLRACRVESPARPAVDKLDDRTGQISRRRRCDELV